MNNHLMVASFGLLIISLLIYPSLSHRAYGDGLFMEQLSASFGDRNADLLIKMNPPVVTTKLIKEQAEKPTVQFKLFDSNSNQTFKQVTYFITIEKNGKPLLSDWFFNPEGNLTLEMQPRNQNQITVYGELDPILNAYSSRGQSPVVAAGPIFLEGGLYHFIIRIVTVDFSRTLLPDDQQPIFDGWLSVGASQDAEFDINGTKVPINVISYYDELNNITYDKSANSLNLSMPFTYDEDRMNDPKNNVFVHEEISVPKPSPLSSTGGYTGIVNGKDLTKVLTVDGNNQTKDVIHFLMSKPVVQQLVDEYVKKHPSESNSTKSPGAKGVMNFSLIPSQNGSAPRSGTLVCVSGLELCY